MNTALKIVLSIVAIWLTYLVYNTIASEVTYQNKVVTIEDQVKAKMNIIRRAQIAFKDKNKRYSSKARELQIFIKRDSIIYRQQFGDKDDTTTVFREEKFKISVKDSLFKNINIDSMFFVPPHDTAVFILKDSMIRQANINVPTFEIIDPYPFSRDRKRKIKGKTNPLKVGSLSENDNKGNWK